MEEQKSNNDTPKVNVSLSEVARTLFKVSEDDLNKIIEEKGTDFNPISFIEGKYVETLNSIKESEKQLKGRITRETAERKEREVLEGLGLKYEGQKGDEYFDAIKGHFSNSDKDEEFKLLKEKHNNAIKEKSELLKSFEDEKTKAVNDIVSQYESKERINKLKDIASNKYLTRKDLSWSEDEEINQFRAKLFTDQLSTLNTKINEDGSIDLLDENGELKKNEKHHVISFDEVATDILRKTIGVSKQTPKSTPSINGKSSTSVNTPNSLKEFNEAYAKETDPVKKQELFKSFKEQSN